MCKKGKGKIRRQVIQGREGGKGRGKGERREREKREALLASSMHAQMERRKEEMSKMFHCHSPPAHTLPPLNTTNAHCH